MFYHTVKDHFFRHVNALAARPTGSLWDYVPEPRLHTAQPLINDAQSANTGVVDPANEGCGDAEDALRCLGCGRFMHRDDVYPCMDCHATPFHLECLEQHYEKAHPRPGPVQEEKEKTDEGEILQQESEEARQQWANQMTNLKCTMPLSRKIATTLAALASVWFAVGPSWSSMPADVPVSLLQ